MIEKFTPQALEVLFVAQKLAEPNTLVGTEHLLLGLLQVDDGKASSALKLLGVTSSAVACELQSVEKAIIPKQRQKEIEFTSSVIEVLELSLAEAGKIGQNYVGTEHLLLGLIRQRNCTAANLFERLDVSIDKLEKALMARIYAASAIAELLPNSQDNLQIVPDTFDLNALRRWIRLPETNRRKDNVSDDNH